MQIDTTKMSSRGQVVIPLDMRKDIKEGDKLIVIRNGDDLIIKKSIPETLLASHKSLSRTWLTKEEDNAWKDL
ncbi:MAG: AbrB/MazE/SpoVT family DNA-binding domain-containing protein [Nanoarchaeota archaeon]